MAEIGAPNLVQPKAELGISCKQAPSDQSLGGSLRQHHTCVPRSEQVFFHGNTSTPREVGNCWSGISAASCPTFRVLTPHTWETQQRKLFAVFPGTLALLFQDPEKVGLRLVFLFFLKEQELKMKKGSVLASFWKTKVEVVYKQSNPSGLYGPWQLYSAKGSRSSRVSAPHALGRGLHMQLTWLGRTRRWGRP